jgi:hypothetical protein
MNFILFLYILISSFLQFLRFSSLDSAVPLPESVMRNSALTYKILCFKLYYVALHGPLLFNRYVSQDNLVVSLKVPARIPSLWTSFFYIGSPIPRAMTFTSRFLCPLLPS